MESCVTKTTLTLVFSLPRFLQADASNSEKFSYVPFGAGMKCSFFLSFLPFPISSFLPSHLAVALLSTLLPHPSLICPLPVSFPPSSPSFFLSLLPSGRHRCVGESFAYVQIKTIWSVLLRKYEFDLCDGFFPPVNYSTMIHTPLKPIIKYHRRAMKQQL